SPAAGKRRRVGWVEGTQVGLARPAHYNLANLGQARDWCPKPIVYALAVKAMGFAVAQPIYRILRGGALRLAFGRQVHWYEARIARRRRGLARVGAQERLQSQDEDFRQHGVLLRVNFISGGWHGSGNRDVRFRTTRIQPSSRRHALGLEHGGGFG